MRDIMSLSYVLFNLKLQLISCLLKKLKHEIFKDLKQSIINKIFCVNSLSFRLKTLKKQKIHKKRKKL